MASAEHEPIMGERGWSPSRVQGQSPWLVLRRLCPHETEGVFKSLVTYSRGKICPLLGILQTVHNSKNLVK